MAEHPLDSLELEDYLAFRRLYDRFGVKASDQSGKAWLSRVLVPVTNVDELVGEWRSVTGSTPSIGAGVTTGKEILVVPRGKRWRFVLGVFQRTSGDNEIKDVRIRDASRNNIVTVEFYAGVAEAVVNIQQPLVLEELDSWYVDTDGTGGSASVFEFEGWVFEEDSFAKV